MKLWSLLTTLLAASAFFILSGITAQPTLALCETHSCPEHLQCISTGPGEDDFDCRPVGWQCTADACPAGERCIITGPGINDYICRHQNWPCTADACPAGQTCISTGNGINDYRCEDPNTPPDTLPETGGDLTENPPAGDAPPHNPLDVARGPSAETFDSLDPLQNFGRATGGSSGVAAQLSTPGGIVSRVLAFAFPIAGSILFLMLVWAGFEIVAGANNSKALDAGKQRATTALVGFILLFVSYWMMQLIQLVFGIQIL